MSLNLQSFFAQLDEIRLIDAEMVRAVAEEIGATDESADAKALGQELVNRGHLTAFQVSALLSGRGKALIIGDYIVLDRLGRGGMGEVYQAQHRIMKRVVALKTLLKSAAENPRLVARFYREAQAAAKLTHPNIVTAHDAGEADGQIYLITEYVDGQDLSKLIKHHGRLPVEAAVNITMQAAEGLAYAHSQGVIHRDIKPGNILVSREGVAKLLDMGLARLIEEGDGDEREKSLTLTGRLMGTVEYMAPEHVANPKHADHRADIYSLGCTMYRLLTGKLPFRGETAMEIAFAQKDEPTPTLADEITGLPIGLQQVFAEMLAKDPEDRYQSAEQLGRDLKTVVPEAVDHVVVLDDFQLAVMDVDPEAETTPEGAAIAAEAEAEERAEALRVDRPVSPSGGMARIATLSTDAHDRAVAGGAIPVARARRSRAEKESTRERRLRRIQISRSDDNRNFLIWGTVAAIVGAGIVVAVLVNVLGVAQGPDTPVPKPPTPPPVVVTPPTPPGVPVGTITPGAITPADGEVELLPRIDPKRDAVAGEWAMRGGRLALTQGAEPARLDIPVRPEGTYRAQFTVRRTGPSQALLMTLPVGTRAVRLEISGANQSATGFSQINGRGAWSPENPSRRTGRHFKDDQDHVVAVRVSTSGEIAALDARLDGQPLAKWSGPIDSLSLPGAVGAAGTQPLGVGAWQTAYEFSSIKLQMLAGEAKVLRPSPAAAPPDRRTNHALEFDGKTTSVSVPVKGMKRNLPLTVEAFVYLGEYVPVEKYEVGRDVWRWSQLPALNLSQVSRPDATQWNVRAQRILENRHASFSSHVPAPGGAHHVAVVVPEVGRAYLFIDGVAHPIFGGSFPEIGLAEPRFFIGWNGKTGGPEFLGRIDELRISNVVRYDGDSGFTPPKPTDRFTPDEHTLALYHFDEGQGDVLKDSSGNGHDGKIHDAKWVKVEAEAREAITANDRWRNRLVLGTQGGLANTVAFSRDSRRLASIHKNGQAHIWQASDGKLLHTIKTSGVGLSWSPDGKLLGISTKSNGKVKLFDATAGRLLEKPLGRGDAGLAFAPDGLTAAAVSIFGDGGKGQLELWNVAEPRLLWSQPTPNAGGMGARFVAYSPDGKLLATGGEPAVTLRHADSGEIFARWPMPGGGAHVNHAAFSPNGEQLAVAADGNQAFVFEVATGKLLFKLYHPGKWVRVVRSVAYSPDGRYLAAGLSNRNVWLWDAETGKRLNELVGPSASLWAVAFSPDGNLIATGGRDGEVVVWERAESPSGARVITPADDWFDVLPFLKPKTARGEDWKIVNEELVGKGRIYDIPLSLQGNHEIQIEFTMGIEGRGWTNFSMADGQNSPYVEVIGTTGLNRFNRIDATNLVRATPVKTGQRHTLLYKRIDRDAATNIEISIDGKQWAKWSGLTSELRSEKPKLTPKISSPDREVTVHSYRVRMLSGEARLSLPGDRSKPNAGSTSSNANPSITPADGEVDLVPYIDPSKDAEFGNWRVGISGKLSVISHSTIQNVVKNRLSIPVAPSGGYELRVTLRDCDFYHHLAAVRLPIFGRSTWLRISRDVDPLVFAPNADSKLENGPRRHIPRINSRMNLVVQVKRAGEQVEITASFQNKPWLNWKGPLETFPVAQPDSKDHLLGLGGDAHLLFDKVALHVLDGDATPLREHIVKRPSPVKSPSDYETIATEKWQAIPLRELISKPSKDVRWDEKAQHLILLKTKVKLPGDDVRNAIMRAELKVHWAGAVALRVRGYEALMNADGIGLHLFKQVDGKRGELKRVQSTVQPFDWFELTIATIDERVLVFVDGKKVMDVKDQTHAAGPLELFSDRGFDVRRLEVMRLDDSDPDRAVAEWVLGIGGRVATDASEFTDVSKLPQEAFRIRRVKLDVNRQVTDADLKQLKGLADLSSLFLYRTRIGDLGLEHLKELRTLKFLNLDGTRVSDAGLEHISGMTRLRSLYLSDTDVGDTGLQYVKGLKDLAKITLRGTRVSDVGLEHLRGLTKLVQVDLSRTNVTAQGIADLKKALPECEIKWDGEAPPKPKAMTEDEAREALAGLFAERLELAGDTEEKDDDIAVATSMLEMAEEKDVAPALRAVLCEKVFELAGQEPKGFAAAVAAMDLMAEHDAEQADVYRIKAISLYAGRFGAVEEEQRPAAALGLIRLLQGYARRSEEAGDLARARAHILQAARTARVVELPQALLLEDKVRRLDERARARTEAEELATKLEETPDDQLLHRQLMNLHLLSLDDPAVALEHVDLAGESESRHFLELAAEVAGGLGELDLLMVGRWYRSLAEDVREGRQQTALERANEVYTWYLARHRDDDAERATAQAEREEIETALAEPRSEDADRKPGGPWTSLLAFASASAEAADGERWQVDDGGLSGSGKIFLPLHPEGSYRVRLRFHPPQDTGWEMRVPIGGRSVPVYIRPDQVVAVGKPLDVQGDPLLSPARLEELELTVLRRGEQILVAVDLNGSPYGFGQIQIPAEVEGVEDEPAPAGFVVIGRNISMAAAEIRMVDGWMRLLAADGP